MFFNEILEGKPDPVFGLSHAFKADPRKNKVDLTVGIYRDEDLKSELLPSVKEAKKRLSSHDLAADYLPFEGVSSFVSSIGELLFGKALWDDLDGKTYGAQSLGGTGALRLGAEFLASEVTKTVAISHPSWPNHRQVFERAGFQIENYPYYDKTTRKFDCKAMCEGLSKLPPKTAIILHTACHNPTGRDPNEKEWAQIFQVIRERKLIPFFDCAYQGFGEGLEKDVLALRMFSESGPEMVIAYSCSKNFSLYNERVGALFISSDSAATKFRIGSKVKQLIRTLYSNPPSGGARAAAEILKTPELKQQWMKEVDAMRERLTSTRHDFIQRLEAKDPRFSYLKGHLGLFMYIDLTKPQVDRLIQEHAIYLLDSGRISIAGLNKKNIGYVVDSILEVTQS